MQPENAIRCFDLDRFDKAGMRNLDRMQDIFEKFLPKFQKALQLGEIWVEIVVRSDVTLQHRYRIFAVVRPYPSTC